MVMKGIDIVNCALSYMYKGNVTVRERLTVRNSSINITEQQMNIFGSSILLWGVGSNNGLLSYSSKIFIAENSSVVFERFINTALYATNSSLKLRSSTLKFIKNIQSNSSYLIFNFWESQMDVAEGSSVVFSNNTIANVGFRFYNSNVTFNAGKLAFEKNKGQNESCLLCTFNTTIELKNESCFNIIHNYWSTSSVFGGGLKLTSDSTLLVYIR